MSGRQKHSTMASERYKELWRHQERSLSGLMGREINGFIIVSNPVHPWHDYVRKSHVSCMILDVYDWFLIRSYLPLSLYIKTFDIEWSEGSISDNKEMILIRLSRPSIRQFSPWKRSVWKKCISQYKNISYVPFVSFSVS